MDLLKKYLNKLGVKEFAELNEEEKETYRGWEESLKGKRLTDEDVAVFLINLENETITELIDEKLSDRRDIFLKMQLSLVRRIKSFLMSPSLQKAMTERGIDNLLK